jgi:hypothetical protein
MVFSLLAFLVLSGFVAMACFAPTQFRDSGLDFWNVNIEESERTAKQILGQELDEQMELAFRRAAILNEITDSLCLGRFTLAEAAETMSTVEKIDPKWSTDVKQTLVASPSSTTSRQIWAQYLLTRVKTLSYVAASAGDETTAAALSARATALEEEWRRLLRTPDPSLDGR